MWAKAIGWIFGTAMGRGVLLGASMMIGALASWYFVSSHYYEKGLAACQLQSAVDTNKANVEQGQKNIENNATSSEVGKAADTAAASVVAETEKDRAESKETIDHVYDRPPTTAPIASCVRVHPVDNRVQDRIRRARLAAIGARAP